MGAFVARHVKTGPIDGSDLQLLNRETPQVVGSVSRARHHARSLPDIVSISLNTAPRHAY